MQMMGGVFLWIQILLVALIVLLTVQKFIRYFGKKGPSAVAFHKSHHAILFLGIFGFVWGMFTQLVGLIQALNAIIEAADVSPELIFMGLRNSFINPLIGFITAILSAVAWGILQGRYTARMKASD